MKLKSYTIENAAGVIKGKATVHISISSGVFSLSKEACKMMGIKIGDSIEIHQDEDNPKDWYFEKSKKGFTIWKSQNGLKFNNSLSARELLKSIGKDCNVAIRISPEPIVANKKELWPLITYSADPRSRH